MKQYVSIDIGGTSIKYGVVNEAGVILVRGQRDTQAAMGGPAIVEKVKEIVRGYQNTHMPDGVCISTAGMVDCETAEIFFAGPQIPHYIGINWKREIKEAFGLPCEAENDVNCAGLAEARSGAGEGSKICLCLTIGTGIGGCAVIDGHVYRGFSGSACEVGYMHLPGGAFQDLASTTALVNAVSARKNSNAFNGEKIFTLALEGDTVCIEEIERLCHHLATGIANICYVLNPEVVILGGGIMAQQDFLRPRMQAALRQVLIPAVANKTELAFAHHRNNAGMLGAFYHFLQRQEKQ